MDRKDKTVLTVATLIFVGIFILLVPSKKDKTQKDIPTTTEVTTEATTMATTQFKTTTEATVEVTTELTTRVTTETTTEATTELTTVATTEAEYIPEKVVEVTEAITEEKTTEIEATPTDAEYNYNSEEVEMLAHLINGEAGATWCSDTTRYYVGSVVLNRVNHPDFPDTIAGVIWQSGQYACTWDGNYDRTPSDRCYEIARDLLENGSWLPDNVVFQANFSQGSGVYDYIDGVYFCYR